MIDKKSALKLRNKNQSERFKGEKIDSNRKLINFNDLALGRRHSSPVVIMG